MNKLPYILVFFLSMFMFSGCQKWGEPEFKAEEWEEPEEDVRFWTIGPNIDIPKFSILRRHTNGTPPDTIILPANQPLRYLRAVVVSSDEGGNYYKSMVIQDATGGVELQLDMAGLYNTYPVGQKIVLVLNGLLIGDYNNLPQIGWLYQENQIGRINSLYFDKYIIKDGLPSPNNLPKALTNDEIDFSSLNDINKLVRLEGVTFEKNAIDKPFAFSDFNTDWKIYVPLANGNEQEVTVRTSNFAKFRSMIIEEKEYNLTGILTIYRTSYQLMIRTKGDIETAQSEESISFDFTTNPIGEGKWENQSLLGSTQWLFRNSSMYHAGNKEYQAYQTAMDDWFISPVITCSDIENGYLIFEHQLPVLNGIYDAYQVFYTTSTSKTFNKDEWQSLGELKSFPASFDGVINCLFRKLAPILLE